MSTSPTPRAASASASPVARLAGPREEQASKPASSPSAEPKTDKDERDDVDDNDNQSVDSEGESHSDGEVSDGDSPAAPSGTAPPLPNEAVPGGPPLPKEPIPSSSAAAAEDDGWDCQWDPASQAWFFYNRFTGNTQWDNPRVPSVSADVPRPPENEKPAAGGYNPAIHGDYDPNAWYAQGTADPDDETSTDAVAVAALTGADPSDPFGASAAFNRFTGQFQAGDLVPSRHGDEAKSRRQMNVFFDVDAAANAHDGRSLKAERTNKKPSKAELKAFKEKRRARKEEKRRAWLRD